MPGRGPSVGAVKIARVVAFIGQHPQLESLLPEGAFDWTVRILSAAGKLKPWMLRLFRSSWFRSYYRLIELRTMPGQVLHICLRKRFFDDETCAAITDGATQVLAVGAGFDSLCVRLAAEHPEVTFVEVDRPSTHALKRASVEKIGALDRCPNLHLLGVDLSSSSLDDVLARTGVWRAEARSVVLAEGVLMYLPEHAVADFLRAVRDLGAAGSRLVFSYMRLDQDGRLMLGRTPRLSRLALWITGEPMCWGVQDGDLEPFLRRHGFDLVQATGCHELRHRYLDPAGLGDRTLSDLERMAVASVQRPISIQA